uniref:TVP38/TMEM64 family membrane protein slr0305 n=1 Tax=Anthurium amnicola TaxID=1678845 RepID=A0A1D1Z678_9ARAE
MTYGGQLDEVIVAPEEKLRMGDGNGDYIRLGQPSYVETGASEGLQGRCLSRKWRSFWWWAKVVFLCVSLSAVAAACVFWGGPLLIDKVVIPILDWERTTFCIPVLGLLLFASIAIFPTFLLPSAPSMWLAGMTFGYGYGFLLIVAGTSLGMSLPYFIGSLFRHRIHRWLEKWPKKAAIIRLAGEGNWFHQFRSVALLRVSPFPYIIFNYAAVATNVRYFPYILGSLIGTIPDTFLSIYSGILIQKLADASHGHGLLSVEQVVYDVLGFCGAVVATIAITVYAKKTLQMKLQTEDVLQ